MMFLVSFISITVISCGDDDKNEPEPDVDKNGLLLIGEWNRIESDDSHYGYHLVFLEDGTGYDKVIYGDSYNIDGTFEWSVKDSNLSIIWRSYKESFTIVSVTAKELIIRDNDDPDNFTYFTRIDQ